MAEGKIAADRQGIRLVGEFHTAADHTGAMEPDTDYPDDEFWFARARQDTD